jgi:vacuolar-type H+-ATPase subunit E/Vma4
VSLDTLLASLEREADAEIARTLAEAQAAAAALTAEAEVRLAARRDTTVRRSTETRRAALERSLADARRTARERVLTARALMLDRVFAALADALPDVGRGAAYQASLAAELREALAFTRDPCLAVRCAPAVAPALRREIARAERTVAIRPDPQVAGGFVLASGDGRLEVDATLTTRLEQRRRGLALAALAALENA